ncbi:hypothetical protein BKA64DRAFT_636019 [Cadophora sp. MPI-SDFR-AT-0126]|nr:hypothetical protein BKA64DRAFT_636019 [Leotiomycetes sp. MPI-SDFR-AT-0126]
MGWHCLTLVPLLAQSCDRDDDNNTTTNNGNDDSEHRALSPQLTIGGPKSTQPHLPTHSQWLQTARKLLRSLSKRFVRDEELLDLNVTISELQDPPAGFSSIAGTATIIAFFQTEAYHSEMRCLDAMGFQRRTGRSKSCAAYISALLVDWTEVLAKQAGDQVEFLRAHPLHVTADLHTRGVLSTLTIVPKQNTQRPLISFVRRKQPLNEGLTATELYTLLALAARKHSAQPFVEDTAVYQVEMLSFYSHWVQRITAKIPSSYLRSIIQGQGELVGRVEICRSPWLNFLEEASQRQILQGIFERRELSSMSPPDASTTNPAAIRTPRKRKAMVENAKAMGGKRRRTHNSPV